MAVHDLEGRRQPVVAPECFEGIEHPLPACTSGQAPRTTQRGVARADRLEVTHQRRRIGVGQGKLLHVHHGLGKAGIHQHVAEIVHIDEAADVSRPIHARERGAQLPQRVGSESREGEQPPDPQHAMELGESGRRIVDPLQRQVAPDEIDRAAGERQPAGIRAHQRGRSARVGARPEQPRQQRALRCKSGGRPPPRREEHRQREIEAGDERLGKTRSQLGERVARTAAGIEDRGRLKLHEGEPLGHALPDLALEDGRGVVSRRCALEGSTHALRIEPERIAQRIRPFSVFSGHRQTRS